MPRSIEIIMEVHNRIRMAMAFFMDHVLMHHVSGFDMGRLVLRYVIERLTELKELVEAEIHLLLIDEGLIDEDEFEVEEESSSANSEDEREVEP